MPINLVSLGRYLESELTLYDSTFYELPQDDLWGTTGMYIPSRGDLPFGVEKIVSYRQDYIGRASISDGVALDVPLVDSGIASGSSKAVLILAGARWTLGELQRDQFANTQRETPAGSLVETKTEGIQVAINRRLHELVYGGAPEIAFYGMFNSTKITVSDQTATQVLQMTPAVQYGWLQGIIGTFKVTSKLAYQQITIYVNDDLYTSLTRRFSDNTGDSAFLLLTDPTRGRFCKEILPITELSEASLENLGIFTAGAQRSRMIIGNFENDRSVIRHFHMLDKTEPIIQDSGVAWAITGYAATSEVDYKVPERFQYIDYGSDPTP